MCARSGLLLVLLLLVSSAFGQTRKELEAKRRALQREIAVTNELLEKNQQNRTAALNRYITLQKQIKRRRELIETLRTEIDYAERSIGRAGEVTKALQRDVELLREEYGEALRVAYRKKLQRSNWLLLYSAGSLNEGFRRWQYLRQYDRNRRRQAELIAETQQMLNGKIREREAKRQEQKLLLAEQENQTVLLAAEMKTKNRLLEELKENEGTLRADLEAKNAANEQLSAAIETEIRKALPLRRKRQTDRTAVTRANERPLDNSTMDYDLTSDFVSKKGKLPYPVRSGMVVRRYGEQAHPTLRNIQMPSNGIDIQTSIGEEARAIFEGRVLSVQDVPTGGKMVLLRHGEFFSVYSNLSQVFVQRGEAVNSRQKLGLVATDPQSGTAELHFELWRNKERVNPTQWISK